MSSPYDGEKGWPGPTPLGSNYDGYGYGSKPVGGCGTSASLGPTQQKCAEGPSQSEVKNISTMARETLERITEAWESELRRAIARAEEQGYRVGYDAAAQQNVERTLDLLEEIRLLRAIAFPIR